MGPSAYAFGVLAFEFTDHATVKAQLEENLVSLLGIVLPAAVGITALSRNLAYVLVGANFAQAVIELAPWLCLASAIWTVRAYYFDSAFHLARNTRPLITVMAVTPAAQFARAFCLIPSETEPCAALLPRAALGARVCVASV